MLAVSVSVGLDCTKPSWCTAMQILGSTALQYLLRSVGVLSDSEAKGEASIVAFCAPGRMEHLGQNKENFENTVKLKSG